MVTFNFKLEMEMWPFRACAMKNMQYNHYYINSSVTVDLAMGQIPHSTERISSCVKYTCVSCLHSLKLLYSTIQSAFVTVCLCLQGDPLM